MKNKKIWYLGYIIGICFLVPVFALRLNNTMNIVLTLLFATSVGISHAQLSHEKMMETDYDYKISNKDERMEKIRDKVNGTMSSVLMILMGIIAVVSISVKAYIPAALLAISLFSTPLIMFFINRYYENRY